MSPIYSILNLQLQREGMRKLQRIVPFLALVIMLTDCDPEVNQERQTKDRFDFSIKNLSDQEYPDNPDIGFRTSDYSNHFFDRGILRKSQTGYSLVFYSGESGDSILVEDIDLMEFIPTIPEHIREDDYLKYISLVNQEWNRNQVRFDKRKFHSSIPEIQRTDIARNCLNSYLWEVIIYKQENGDQLPHGHGWFDFPPEIYRQLFEEKNGISFSRYSEPLENWIDPESNIIDFAKFRQVQEKLDIRAEDRSNEMYPLKGERKRKQREIIIPKEYSSMRDFQTDSTCFATFSPPGYYKRSDPRQTELGRIRNLDNATISRITCGDQESFELVLAFSDESGERKTDFVLGGFDPKNFPILEEQAANDAWKGSMGIGNHTFYESYDQHIAHKTSSNPYYALLVDEEGRWLDSHKIGIDGPLIHRDPEDHNIWHIWLLSFERHALVGHYEVEIL